MTTQAHPPGELRQGLPGAFVARLARVFHGWKSIRSIPPPLLHTHFPHHHSPHSPHHLIPSKITINTKQEGLEEPNGLTKTVSYAFSFLNIVDLCVCHDCCG